MRRKKRGEKKTGFNKMIYTIINTIFCNMKFLMRVILIKNYNIYIKYTDFRYKKWYQLYLIYKFIHKLPKKRLFKFEDIITKKY